MRVFEELKDIGLDVPPFAVAHPDDVEEVVKSFDLPVVVKLASETLHKTDVGGVKIIRNKEEIPKALAEIKDLSRKFSTPILVQKFVSGTEVFVGVKRDPVFGYVTLFGLGGIFVEIFRDVSGRIYPFTVSDAREMIGEIKGYKILEGYRGAPKVNLNKLAETIVKLTEYVIKKGAREADFNPIICNEEGCWIVDVRILY